MAGRKKFKVRKSGGVAPVIKKNYFYFQRFAAKKEGRIKSSGRTEKEEINVKQTEMKA